GLCRVNEQSTFYVQGARTANEVKITIQGPQSDPKVQVSPFDGNKVAVSFTPLHPGNYNVFGTYTGANIPGSPVTVQAADPSKLEILSQIPAALQVGEVEEIFVKSNNVGPGNLLAKSSHTRFLEVAVIDQENNSFLLKLKPLE
ncbi:filamin/ABP280 repeat domain-containing protein, partial [Salmonella sp. s51228]|uniref:filamin/ABP280 repeat domain-containing protein n=1 Tax=Salmonella sp. s51228 TaxID=3159652 RepID=UPI00397F9CA7